MGLGVPHNLEVVGPEKYISGKSVAMLDMQTQFKYDPKAM
jgi:hypothetical protein